MGFRTRLDLSDNRQHYQRVLTDNVLSGKTVFGVPYASLPSGIDYTTTAITETYDTALSTFSGNTGTTTYTWYDNRMELAVGELSAITPSNSGTVQNTGYVWIGDDGFTTVDGNTGFTSYSGVSYDIVVNNMIDLGGGNYSGTVVSNLIEFLSAGTFDYTGQTLWLEVSGTAKTEKLIVTDNATAGYVLTVMDSDGTIQAQPATGGTGTTYWQEVGASNGGLTDTKGSNTVTGTVTNSMIAGGNGHVMSAITNSFLGGGDTNTIIDGQDSAIVGGFSNTIQGSSEFTFIGGGRGNDITNGADYGAILGSFQSTIDTASLSTIVGSANSNIVATTTSSDVHVIIGGQSHSITPQSSSDDNNSIFGGLNNTIDGGQQQTILGGLNHTINSGNSSTIIGGFNHVLTTRAGSSLDQATIIGGSSNNIIDTTSDSDRSAIIAGINNTIADSIDCGMYNVALSDISGTSNQAVLISSTSSWIGNSNYSTIIGAQSSSIDASDLAVIAGGDDNLIFNTASRAFIGGGFANENETSNGAIVGGSTNKLDASSSAGIFAGQLNLITGSTTNGAGWSAIVGGLRNTVDLTKYSTIIGGKDNEVFVNNVGTTEEGSAIYGGSDNYIRLAWYSTILSSTGSTISAGDYSVIVGGENNGITAGTNNVVAGGTLNVAGVSGGDRSFIGGGSGNTLSNAASDSAIIAAKSSEIFGADTSAIIAGVGHYIDSSVSNNAIIGGTNNYIDFPADRSVIIGGQNITASTDDMVYVPDLTIDGLTSTDPIATDANGVIVAGTSDARLKTKIKDLDSALDKINKLRGVSFEWTEESNMGAGVTKYGFLAQEVQEVIPDMVRLRYPNKEDDTLTLSYTEVVPWLVEAVKELASGNITIENQTVLNTQHITSEDNDIELNYGGTKETAKNGGISVKNAVAEGVDSFMKVDENGRWIIGPSVTMAQLTLPEYTPTSSEDNIGSSGDVVWDDKYLYIKTNEGWRRTGLESF